MTSPGVPDNARKRLNLEDSKLSVPTRGYIKLLRQMTTIHGAPAAVLPLPKDQLRLLLESEQATATDPRIQELLRLCLESLQVFTTGVVARATGSMFVSAVITGPFFLGAVLGVVLGLRRGEWWWVLAPVLIAIGGGGALLVRVDRNASDRAVRLWVRSVALAVLELMFLIGYGGLWMRVVFGEMVGGFLALIRSFDLGSLVALVVISFIGYHYTKAVNTAHFFVFSAPWRGYEPDESSGQMAPSTN